MIRSRLNDEGNFIIELELEIQGEYMKGVDPRSLEAFVERVSAQAVAQFLGVEAETETEQFPPSPRWN